MKCAIPLYGGHLKVYVTNDFKGTADRLRLRAATADDALDLAEAKALTHFVRDTLTLVVFLRPKTSHDVVAHEAVHCATHVFAWIGSGICAEHDEPFAYLAQWFAASINAALGR